MKVAAYWSHIGGGSRCDNRALAGLSGLRDSEIGIGGMEYYDNLFDRDLVETGIRAGRPD
jgi:hypothetical protein